MKDKTKQKKYMRRRIVFFTLVSLIIFLVFLNISKKSSMQKIALGENALDIGGEQLDISRVISSEPNVPAVGAGMIPIKWNDTVEMWQITTTTDTEWYNYANGKWANIMLSDGVYQSELQVDMTNKKLAEKNIGVQIREEELGSIFTWIPRLAYFEDRVEFLKNTSVLDYMWTTEGCFNLEKYGANFLDLGFTGIWVGQKEFANLTELENKNAQMQLEENIEGLIANEKVTSLTNSEKIAVQKLQTKYNTALNKTMIQNADTMQYRQIIKKVNTNNRLPIMGTHVVVSEGVVIRDKYSEYGIKYVVDKDGNRLEKNIAVLDNDEIQIVCYIVDNNGNIRRYKATYGTGKPYLKGFNKNTTFYVTYDENGNENSTIPIGEKPPANWYSYENQQWANVVSRDNGNEIYYVWIPRYMYKLRTDGSETVDVRFVDLENVWTDPDTGTQYDLNKTDYLLPEAFTWEDPDDPTKVVQLTGYWLSKYKLREGSTYHPTIYGLGGSVGVDGVVAQYGTSYTYEMYLIKDGKRIVKNIETKVYEEGTEPIILTGDYKFTGLDAGNYAVNIIIKDSNGNHVQAVSNQVTVLEKIKENAPDLSTYNEDLTYYVTYSADGKENSIIPIGEDEPTNWYDYDEGINATIVVRDAGTEKYYEWIPRYQCKTANSTHIMYIKTDKVVADAGYTIPAEFTAEDGTALSGYWKEKNNYSNRLLATVTVGETKIRVSDIISQTSDLTYEISVIKDGRRIKTETISGTEHTFTDLEAGQTYAINLVAKDTEGTFVSAYSKQVTLIKIIVDTTGFNQNTTFYVTYDDTGNEDSSVPIGEEPPADWYEYADQKWANVVSRDNGNEIYYVWIPRYEYKLDTTNQKTIVQFISTEKETADEGYQIPESFTWEDPNDSTKVVQLSGYWLSKYKLRAATTYNPSIYGLGGAIRVDGVVAKLGDSYTYEMYLIKDGKRIVKNASTGKYEEGKESIDLKANLDANGNYKFTGLDAGNYSVNIIIKDSNGNHVQAISNQVTVLEKVQVNPPDLSSYNKNITYYAVYNLLGETSNTPIGENAPTNWYDYDEEIKATIVVRDSGTEKYYEWIPRYQCETADNSRIVYIPTSKIEPDAGYTIPSKFTTTNEAGETVQLSGYWQEKENGTYSNRLLATVASGENKIRVSNIISTTTATTYNIYLIKDGKKVDNTLVISSGEYTFNITESGKYAVLVEQINTITGTVAGFAKEVRVQPLEPPDVTGFRIDTTYIVKYDDEGNEDTSQTLESILKEGYTVDANNALVSGQIDINKISGTWYDYTEQKWANIVTINNEKTIYYTWIPRYEYKLDTTNQKVNAILIPKTQETADEGYQISEAFTWEDPNDSTKVVQLSGYWLSKYKLRQ